ncbi:hypothetical protein [Candidatus Tremblaya phenacola]|uniref:hypothetical protein n=1 Tax=Candidatus Tremblayella phenacoccinincola TaxID=1010676 RepID=UPI00197D5CB6|nr:hypothetical protein [Candidatus Tremblaya phenacola]KAH0998205.1 Histidinol-phosphatase [Candidatus Tremblaya phenacola]
MNVIYLFIDIFKPIKPLNNKAIGLMLALKDHKVKLVILISKPAFNLTAGLKENSLKTYIAMLYMLTYLGVEFRLASIGSSDLKVFYMHIEKASRVLAIGSTVGKRYYIANNNINIAHCLGIKSIHIKLLNLSKTYKAILNRLIANFYLSIYRLTNETSILIDIWLTDEPIYNYINTSIGFFNHMLNQIATHGNFRIVILARGDNYIDDHHIIEDVAIALGSNIKTTLNTKLGISRFSFIIPMDECIAQCVLDMSNRFYLVYKSKYSYQKTGDINNSMIEHFFRSLSCSLTCSIYLTTKGTNDHHRIESIYKVFGIVLSKTLNIISNKLPSSKGLL